MAKPVDQTEDLTHVELHRLSTLYDFPDFVKQAAVGDIIADGELPSAAYGDMLGRRFPLHTKAAAWLSNLFYLENAEALPEERRYDVQRCLDKAAVDWGLQQEVADLKVRYSDLRQEKLADSDFMLVRDGVRHYPLRNAQETKQAADWLVRYRDRFEYADRRNMAQQVLRKAAKFSAALSESTDQELEQMAGRGSFNVREAAQSLRNRAIVANAPAEAKEAIIKLASVVESQPQLGICPGTIEKLCHTVDRFDREYGISRQYCRSIPRPEHMFCQVGWKQAQAAVTDAVQLTTGHVFSKAALSQLPLSVVRGALGDDLAEAVADGLLLDVEKAAEVLPTLPRPDAEVFAAAAATCNVRPAEKMATDSRLSRATLAAITVGS